MNKGSKMDQPLEQHTQGKTGSDGGAFENLVKFGS